MNKLIEIKKETTDKFVAFYRSSIITPWFTTMLNDTYDGALNDARCMVADATADIKVFKVNLPI